MATQPVHHCSRCSYELTGLSMRGRCPECGHVYDRHMLDGVKQWLTAEQRGDRILSRFRTMALVALTVMSLACGGVSWYLRPTPRPVWISLIVAVVSGLAAFTSYLYEKNDG